MAQAGHNYLSIKSDLVEYDGLSFIPEEDEQLEDNSKVFKLSRASQKIINTHGFEVDDVEKALDKISIKSSRSIKSFFYNHKSIENSDSFNPFNVLRRSRSSSSTLVNLNQRLESANIEFFAQRIPPDKIRSREIKWIDLIAARKSQNLDLNAWKQLTKNNFEKLKKKCRKGKSLVNYFESRIYIC